MRSGTQVPQTRQKLAISALCQILRPVNSLINVQLDDFRGTTGYKAPEVIAQKGHGVESDMFAFGVCLYVDFIMRYLDACMLFGLDQSHCFILGIFYLEAVHLSLAANAAGGAWAPAGVVESIVTPDAGTRRVGHSLQYLTM